MTLTHRTDAWRARILDPQVAMRWADMLAAEEGDEVADAFRLAFNEKAIFGEEHGEYRYWATGTHEPVTQEGEA